MEFAFAVRSAFEETDPPEFASLSSGQFFNGLTVESKLGNRSEVRMTVAEPKLAKAHNLRNNFLVARARGVATYYCFGLLVAAAL